MSDKKKIQSAAQRVKTNKATKSKRNGFWKRVWNIICWPFRKIAKLCRWLWNWLCRINLVGLVNLTLLVAIIVLFSMLVIDVIGCNRKTVVVMAKDIPVTAQVEVTENSAPSEITQRNTVLPIKVNPKTNKKEAPAKQELLKHFISQHFLFSFISAKIFILFLSSFLLQFNAFLVKTSPLLARKFLVQTVLFSFFQSRK